ncbi:SusC/RagA family TonB-linked outer membrane protein [Pedobacter heparinus]|uniref:SusC/RagA family TonB-linked outer membrane protein n=1 Tax=Pedobacter heparinus TaxID=984 RepID=UPI00292DE835|nr:SusC/RagA family TonB-linked outer membrane protein [Pedobacter heparinus]
MKINENVGMGRIVGIPMQILRIMTSNPVFRESRYHTSKNKFILVMKLTIFIMTACLLQLSASTRAQITLDERGKTLQKVLKSISSQSGYDFIYADQAFRKSKPVTVKLKDADIISALKACFEGQPLMYEISDKTVMVKVKNDDSFFGRIIVALNAIDVRGKVVDQDGKPLPGASVKVKGIVNNAATTNTSGDFYLRNVDENAVLIISYIGYQSREVAVNDIKNGTIVLSNTEELLGEVVVTAYGRVKKQNLTDAVASIDGKTLQDRPLKSLAEGLKGLSPGLNISINSGAPESSPSLNVRGFTSMNSSGSPLVLVDGVERRIQDVNPNDVESISVLKDGASSIIYGSRAPYGVILITTKSGSNGKMVVNYTSNYKFSTAAMMPELPSTYDWATYLNQIALATPNGTGVKIVDDLSLERIKAHAAGDYSNPVFAGLDMKYVINGSFPVGAGYSRYNSFGTDDYNDAYFKTAVPATDQNLSFSGGSERVKYYVGLGYNNTAGVLKPVDNYYKRYNGLTKLQFKATDWLDLDASFNYARANTLGPNIMGQGNNYSTFFSFLGREFLNNPLRNPDNPNYYSSPVYLSSIIGGSVAATSNDLIFTGGFNLRPLKGITINGSYSFRNNTFFNETIQKIVYSYNPNGTVTNGFRSAATSAASKSFGSTDYGYGKLSAEYTKTLANAHHFLAQVGAQVENNQYKQLDGAGQGLFAQDAVTSISTTAGPFTANDALYHWGTLGYYGVITYDFKERYLFKLAARADASSRFAPQSRWGYFPSISAGWNVANENFWKFKDQVSQFKVRASWSKTGDLASVDALTGAPNYYAYLPTMPKATSSQTLLGGNLINYLTPSNLVSSTLTWTKPAVLDFGVDITALKNRLTITYDWYQRTVYDQANQARPISQVLGTATPPENTAVSETRGWEVNIGWNDKFKLAGKDADYGLSFLMSDYIGYVVKYNLNPTGARASFTPGVLFGQNLVYTSQGIVQNTSALNGKVLNGSYGYPGYITYADSNGDGFINGGTAGAWSSTGDLKTDGFNYPRKSYSILPSFSWNNFSVSAILEGVMQWKQYVNNELVFGQAGQFFSPFYQQTLDKGFWNTDNRDAFLPAVGQVPAINDQYMLNLAHLRVRNVTLGYNLPSKWLQKVKLQKVNLYISGENLGFIYNKAFVNYDPALLSAAGGIGYPPMRTYSFGLNVSL